jgi:hypothetical protein
MIFPGRGSGEKPRDETGQAGHGLAVAGIAVGIASLFFAPAYAVSH